MSEQNTRMVQGSECGSREPDGGEEIAETSTEIRDLTERIKLKVRSCYFFKDDKESAFEFIEVWSDGRIKAVDCEKLHELMSEDGDFEGDKDNIMKLRIKNLLMVRKRIKV